MRNTVYAYWAIASFYNKRPTASTAVPKWALKKGGTKYGVRGGRIALGDIALP